MEDTKILKNKTKWYCAQSCNWREQAHNHHVNIIIQGVYGGYLDVASSP